MASVDTNDDGESSGANTESTDSGAGPQRCHETVDPETRAALLDRYDHRCQACGRYGPDRGGLASLHAHHIDREAVEMGEHDVENLTVLCRSCHSWLHQQSTPDDAPVEISEADRTVLLPQDIEILQFLAVNGPLRTGEIAAGVATELSVSAVRERLWVLMGLDNLVDDRETQIVDKDVETGEWGLTAQIENSARGHIPDDQQLLLQRMEDEQVRRALERGCDRGNVTDVLGISRRTTFNKVKRACAYDFPLEAFSRGGRPTGDRSDSSEESTGGDDNDAEQQRFESIPGQDDRGEAGGRTETWGTVEGDEDAAGLVARDECSSDAGDAGESVSERVQEVIDALRRLDAEVQVQD